CSRGMPASASTTAAAQPCGRSGSSAIVSGSTLFTLSPVHSHHHEAASAHSEFGNIPLIAEAKPHPTNPQDMTTCTTHSSDSASCRCDRATRTPIPLRGPVRGLHSRPRPSDKANFLDSLDEIAHAISLAAPPGTQQIHRGSLEYYAASMAIIRLAALVEEDAYESFLTAATTTERRAIATMRNIAAGYREMNDSLLCQTLTTGLPELLDRLRAASD